ncbi:hypothetical protein CH373_11930 [Leptospira perolatii]|uniref:Uncharacterized protein n=1 Tax=Leptospira perolatii TaxID=2023191 RepID=A0A2M9ZL27_9LEPT|nr:hypothetical protein [Leptospira perolatii]PJZ70340.1 hypothetical protein CH360_07040 [Leptospira perolatii]PJZ72776.1 hypothetical protein CH373_11930 [Leptospira perolatii]
MHQNILWPNVSDLRLSEEIPEEAEYCKTVFDWAIQNGATQYCFAPESELDRVLDRSSNFLVFPLEVESLPKPISRISFLIPPILYEKKIILWTESPNSISEAFFQIVKQISELRTQASELVGFDLGQFPAVSWVESVSENEFSMLWNSGWSSFQGNEIRSKRFPLPESYFRGIPSSHSKILSIEWEECLPNLDRTGISKAILEFAHLRAVGKFGDIFRALSASEEVQQGILKYEPRRQFSFGFHLLLGAAIFAEIWSTLVSHLIEERPGTKEVEERIQNWSQSQTKLELTNGIESLFAERTIHLVDKFAGRTDRCLLLFLEKEYEKRRMVILQKRSTRLRKIEEELLPNALLLHEAQSRNSSSSLMAEDSKWWKERAEEKVQNLLKERRELVQDLPKEGSVQAWNKLDSYGSY